VLQCVAVCCSVSQCAGDRTCDTLQHTATHCNTLQQETEPAMRALYAHIYIYFIHICAIKGLALKGSRPYIHAHCNILKSTLIIRCKRATHLCKRAPHLYKRTPHLQKHTQYTRIMSVLLRTQTYSMRVTSVLFNERIMSVLFSMLQCAWM